LSVDLADELNTAVTMVGKDALEHLAEALKTSKEKISIIVQVEE